MTTLDALVTRAKTVGGALRVYKLGAVPSTPGDTYMVLTLDDGTRASTRTDGRSPNRRYRLAVQLFAKTETGLDDMATRAETSFYDQTLTELPDDPFCVRELATQPGRDPDGGGLLYTLHVYRY